MSIRRVPGNDVDNILLSALDDDATSVRRASIAALNSRPSKSSIVSILGEMLQSEPEASVRLDLIRYLGERINQFPEASGYLTALIARESNSENYQTAVALLHQ